MNLSFPNSKYNFTGNLLGVITARGGSKGIPRKNIKDLCGQPLIAYTIKAAQESGIFDRIILSTDDAEIAEVAKKYGVEVPFIRPAELAQDGTPHLPVMQHAVSWLKENENYQPDLVAILQPTAPLRQARHLKEALELLIKNKADSVISVTEIPGHYSPYWAVVADENGLGKLFIGDQIRNRIPRRQNFPKKTYANNGVLYIFKTGLLSDMERPSFYGERVAIYPMAEKYSVNIDSPKDWLLAERAMGEL
ncbi:MAG: acylneuraminate cytidylyltransferase family protein [Parcubacteria group bacterium]|nr:acylneuraminate cytidylyltransferase family protein [Parcubacteria group bacterium]